MPEESAPASSARKTSVSSPAGPLHRRHQPAGPGLRLLPALAARPRRVHQGYRHLDRRGRRGRGRRLHRRRHGGRQRRRPCPAAGWSRRPHGDPHKAPPHFPLVARQGPLRRRPCRRRDRRDAMPQAKDAAELIEVDYDELPAGGEAPARRRRGSACPACTRTPGQPLLRLGVGRRGRGRRAPSPRRPRHQARPRQQPPDPQRHGAARGHRRLRPGTDEL